MRDCSIIRVSTGRWWITLMTILIWVFVGPDCCWLAHSAVLELMASLKMQWLECDQRTLVSELVSLSLQSSGIGDELSEGMRDLRRQVCFSSSVHHKKCLCSFKAGIYPQFCSVTLFVYPFQFVALFRQATKFMNTSTSTWFLNLYVFFLFILNCFFIEFHLCLRLLFMRVAVVNSEYVGAWCILSS